MTIGSVPADVRQHLVRFRANDGFLINALLLTGDGQRKAASGERPVLLQIHGSLGHFLARGTPRLLPHALHQRGIDSLSINTRLASCGQINGQGVFPDTSKDIDAAIRFLTAAGFERIFVLGYSLGASMVAHWAAQASHPNVQGLILEGCPYSIPDANLERSRSYGSSPSYEEVYARAQEVLGDDPYNSQNDETFIWYQSKGPTRKPDDDQILTYKTWWFMCGPKAHAAITHQHIGKIALPMLIVRGDADPLIPDWAPDALGKIAREAGNENVRVVSIAGARHDCMENPEAMVNEIVRFVSPKAPGALSG
jgi:alpha-beta hydrolase superfamily lysophospholipase